MAVDTAAKRKSAAGIPATPLGPGVTPDASQAQAWRQQVGWGYSGIAADSPAPASASVQLAINGTEIPVAYDGAELRWVPRATMTRGVQGTVRDATIAARRPAREWRIRTRNMSWSEAISLEGSLDDAGTQYAYGQLIWRPGWDDGRGLTDPYDFSAGSSWGGDGFFTIATATSHFSGRTAYQHTNDGGASSRNRTQAVGTLSSYPETLALVVETVDADATQFGIRDTTAADWVVRGELAYGTEVMTEISSGVGSNTSVSATELSDGVWLLTVTGTPDNPGNNRSVYIYPTGVGTNTDTAIIHRAELYPRLPCIIQNVERQPTPGLVEASLSFELLEATVG